MGLRRSKKTAPVRALPNGIRSDPIGGPGGGGVRGSCQVSVAVAPLQAKTFSSRAAPVVRCGADRDEPSRVESSRAELARELAGSGRERAVRMTHLRRLAAGRPASCRQAVAPVPLWAQADWPPASGRPESWSLPRARCGSSSRGRVGLRVPLMPPLVTFLAASEWRSQRRQRHLRGPARRRRPGRGPDQRAGPFSRVLAAGGWQLAHLIALRGEGSGANAQGHSPRLLRGRGAPRKPAVRMAATRVPSGATSVAQPNSAGTLFAGWRRRRRRRIAKSSPRAAVVILAEHRVGCARPPPDASCLPRSAESSPAGELRANRPSRGAADRSGSVRHATRPTARAEPGSSPDQASSARTAHRSVARRASSGLAASRVESLVRSSSEQLRRRRTAHCQWPPASQRTERANQRKVGTFSQAPPLTTTVHFGKRRHQNHNNNNSNHLQNSNSNNCNQNRTTAKTL